MTGHYVFPSFNSKYFNVLFYKEIDISKTELFNILFPPKFQTTLNYY